MLSADIKQDAIDTYNANFGESMAKTDLTTLIDRPDMPAFDLRALRWLSMPTLLVGGCQGRGRGHAYTMKASHFFSDLPTTVSTMAEIL